MDILKQKHTCRNCGGNNLYFDKHAGLPYCLDCKTVYIMQVEPTLEIKSKHKFGDAIPKKEGEIFDQYGEHQI